MSIENPKNFEKTDYDLFEFKVLVKGVFENKLIVGITFATFFIGALIYALTSPNIYESGSTLMINSSSSNQGISQLAGQFGGVAALAGINLQSSDGDAQEKALAIFKSRKFLFFIIEKYAIKEEIIASVGWDRHSNEILYDDSLYDSENSNWIRVAKYPKQRVPSNYEVYKELVSKHINVYESEEQGTVEISFQHYSPYFAQNMVQVLVSELNDELKRQAVDEAEASIKYLSEELKNTDNVALQNIFYELIDKNYQTLMLTKVREDFTFKVLDPAVAPEVRKGPNRVGIVILGLFLGGIISILIVILRINLKRK